jgi:hypothetical protein
VEIAKDSGFATIEEDDPQLNEPARTTMSLTSGTKFWRARRIIATHRLRRVRRPGKSALPGSIRLVGRRRGHGTGNQGKQCPE